LRLCTASVDHGMRPSLQRGVFSVAEARHKRRSRHHRATFGRNVRGLADWVSEARDPAAATLELAVQRGLLLDLLTTGDRDRVEAALDRFAASARAQRRGLEC